MVFKDPVSGISHLVSAVAAAVGLFALLSVSPPDPARRLVLLVYGVCLIFLFLASAIYHLVLTRPAPEAVLRRIDHSAIFLLIAGTYTPICVVILPHGIGTALLVAVWSFAVLGIAMKIFFFDKVPGWVSTALYVIMGWLVLFGLVPLIRNLPLAGLLWLAAGGVLYTGGVAFYAMKKLVIIPNLIGAHEVWHFFVTAGAAAHFVLILRFVAAKP
jgi:hemolysin III